MRRRVGSAKAQVGQWVLSSTRRSFCLGADSQKGYSQEWDDGLFSRGGWAYRRAGQIERYFLRWTSLLIFFLLSVQRLLDEGIMFRTAYLIALLQLRNSALAAPPPSSASLMGLNNSPLNRTLPFNLSIASTSTQST